MKRVSGLVFLFVLVHSACAGADCVRNQTGSVVCGGGQCEMDQTNRVYCAAPGGGAVKDRYGRVLCGTGYCERDATGQVWCSTRLGGGAMVDLNGNVKCLGGCDAGAASRCEEAR